MVIFKKGSHEKGTGTYKLSLVYEYSFIHVSGDVPNYMLQMSNVDNKTSKYTLLQVQGFLLVCEIDDQNILFQNSSPHTSIVSQ